MTCYHPLPAIRLSPGQPLKFLKTSVGIKHDSLIHVPCGRCVGCRLDYSREWAVRAMFEAQEYQYNTSVTLTYKDISDSESLNKEDVQKFFKRLRQYIARNKDSPDSKILCDRDGVRYMQCGEYGEKNKRKHHHALLFGIEFIDKVDTRKSKCGFPLYQSKLLDLLWGKGDCLIGEVTFESAAYIARYQIKGGKPFYGEEKEKYLDGKAPEYFTMSRNPGIGYGFLEQFSEDVYNYDEIVERDGRRVRPPKYFDRMLEKVDADMYNNIKERRKKKIDNRLPDRESLHRKERAKSYQKQKIIREV